MKIDRPTWLKPDFHEGGNWVLDAMTMINWFDKYVEPVNKMLAAGVEVFSCKALKDEPLDHWTTNYPPHERETPSYCTNYKALLINTQPIKTETETAEDVLRDYVEFLNKFASKGLGETELDLFTRAKKALK